MRGPIRITGDGLAVFFEVGSSTPPTPIMHLRCAPDLNCQMYVGAPAQGLDAQGTAALEITGNDGKFCVEGTCQPIARCPTPTWTEQERKSGFAKRWESGVNAPRR